MFTLPNVVALKTWILFWFRSQGNFLQSAGCLTLEKGSQPCKGLFQRNAYGTTLILEF